ncbi:MAG: ATP-dependent Clp protease adaptor ClpS [Flavobacteriia bacterium]|nr:ATP-dependent Clp protease adaptor ClpS [Flavobacteriia bacterium]
MIAEPKEKVSVKVQKTQDYSLVLYNDDVNSFDHVINSLMAICNLELTESEQCAWIVHTNGRCSVSHGVYNELEPKCIALLDRGLSAKIE